MIHCYSLGRSTAQALIPISLAQVAPFFCSKVLTVLAPAATVISCCYVLWIGTPPALIGYCFLFPAPLLRLHSNFAAALGMLFSPVRCALLILLWVFLVPLFGYRAHSLSIGRTPRTRPSSVRLGICSCVCGTGSAAASLAPRVQPILTSLTARELCARLGLFALATALFFGYTIHVNLLSRLAVPRVLQRRVALLCPIIAYSARIFYSFKAKLFRYRYSALVYRVIKVK